MQHNGTNGGGGPGGNQAKSGFDGEDRAQQPSDWLKQIVPRGPSAVVLIVAVVLTGLVAWT